MLKLSPFWPKIIGEATPRNSPRPLVWRTLVVLLVFIRVPASQCYPSASQCLPVLPASPLLVSFYYLVVWSDLTLHCQLSILNMVELHHEDLNITDSQHRLTLPALGQTLTWLPHFSPPPPFSLSFLLLLLRLTSLRSLSLSDSFRLRAT